MLGATVSEQLRTFGGICFAWTDISHASRILGDRRYAATDDDRRANRRLPLSWWRTIMHLLPEGDDLGLSMFVTPGPYATLGRSATLPPLVRRSACTPIHCLSIVAR